MPVNRISSPSRWPNDPIKVIDRADRDLDFVDVLEELGFNMDPSLLEIKTVAFKMRTAAQKHLIGGSES